MSEPDPIQRRRQALFERWSHGGRLNKSEFEEIRDLLPEGKCDTRRISPSDPALGGPHAYQKDLIEYESVYGTGLRQIHRWISAGKSANPPELPPLDAPHEMSAWWARHMKHRVPAKLVALALRKPTAASENEGIDISNLQTAAGDAVRQSGTYLAAADKHLASAYASGDDARIEICQRRWLKALDAVRKAEFAAREDAKVKGDLIPKSELLPELSQFLEVMHQMRRSARRRILAKFLVDLSPELTEKLGQAIEQELKRSDAVLRRLKHFRSLEEIDAFELEIDAASQVA
jgi:hypothetical protein